MDLTGKDENYYFQKLVEFDQLKKDLVDSYQEAYDEIESTGSIDVWRNKWLERHSDDFDFFADEFIMKSGPMDKICYALLGVKYAKRVYYDNDPEVKRVAGLVVKGKL